MPADFPRGHKLRASEVNQIKNAPITNITGGPGIIVDRSGNNAVISAADAQSVVSSILAKPTAVHANYLVCKEWVQKLGGNSRRYFDLGTAEFNVAKHPELWNPKAWTTATTDSQVTVQDPVNTSRSLTYAYDGPQTRTVDDGDQTQDQRVLPYWSTDTTNAPPILCIPWGYWLPNDDDSADVYCAFIEVGPRAPAKYTPE